MLRVNGLYGHIQRNNTRSLAMFGGFLIACQLISAALLLLPLLIYDYKLSYIYDPQRYMELFALPILGVSVLVFLVRYALYLKTVQNAANFRIVSKNDEPRLWKIVEIQSVASGLAMPKIAVIEEEARNAFACGRNEKSAIIVATRGLLRALDDDELEAVVAHEITHIVRGDVRLMTVANVMLSTVFLVERVNPIKITRGWHILVIVLMPPFLILFLTVGFISSVATTLGKLSRLLIASSREFIADSEAVRMTKNPSALISALRAIEGRSTIENLDKGVEAMMIDGPVEGAYASHPTIEDRVAALAQHVGVMVHGTGTRKDTRKLGEIHISTNGVFGQRARKTAGTTPRTPAKRLVDRVNSGSGKNAFGLTPRMRTGLILAVGAVYLIKTAGFHSVQRQLEDQIGVAKETPRSQISAGAGESQGKDVGQPNDLKVRIKQLSARDPLDAFCFETKRYSVGDRGLRKLYRPDFGLVKAHYEGKIQSSGVEIEKYLAQRLNSHRQIKDATPDQLGPALQDYVKTRRDLLWIMHRFYGEQGLEYMMEQYASTADNKINRQIGTQLKQGLIFASSKEDAGVAKLLVEHPGEFIPCNARAVLGPPSGSRIVSHTEPGHGSAGANTSGVSQLFDATVELRGSL